ncbi:hypothetical protein ALC53_02688 [Atta colombica]|uniref:Uncharacterized protein n=1 Tax=Atta colombica TaxID=520822 RepID=A0A195BQG2_9HYME|nr:hypothetical protein ALC53_02688 [Atta colombica]
MQAVKFDVGISALESRSKFSCCFRKTKNNEGTLVKRISPLSATQLECFFFLRIRGLCSSFIVKLSSQQGQNVYTVPRYAWPAARGYCVYILSTKIDSRGPKSPMTSLSSFFSSCDVGYEMTSQIIGGAKDPCIYIDMMIDVCTEESECLCNFYVGWLVSVLVFFNGEETGKTPRLAPLPTSVHWPCDIVAADVRLFFITRSRMFSLLRLQFLVFIGKLSTTATMISQTRPDI